MQRCKILGNVPEASAMALQWRRALSIVVGPRRDRIDKTQQAAYLQYRGESSGNRIDKTSESWRCVSWLDWHDRLSFKGSLLPSDTIPDDGGREQRVTVHLRKLCRLVRSHLLRLVLTSTFQWARLAAESNWSGSSEPVLVVRFWCLSITLSVRHFNRLSVLFPSSCRLLY